MTVGVEYTSRIIKLSTVTFLTLTRGPDHQVVNLGHRRIREIQECDQDILPRRARSNNSLRHHKVTRLQSDVSVI